MIIPYTDLIAGEIYKGIIRGANSIWIFKYTPKVKYEQGQKRWHMGPGVNQISGEVRDKVDLWVFDSGWIFSLATEEEIKLLIPTYEKENAYSIY